MVRGGVWALATASYLVCASPARADAPAECGLEDPRIAQRVGPPPVKAREVPGLGRTGLPVVRRLPVGSSARGGRDGRDGRDGRRDGRDGVVGHGAAGGALAGKTVYVSAGHGWTWRPAIPGWRTQRPNTHDLVEDFISIETVNEFLVQTLVNMGAHVVTVRESDVTAAIDVVDDGSARFEAGAGAGLVADSAAGFGVLATPIATDENPFAAGAAQLMQTTAAESARVTWTFDVPADGDYNVYVGYVQGPDRASDAHYVVHHAGGDSEFLVDQRRHGGTWVRLGRFHFRAGQDPQRGAVSLRNDSADAASQVSVDVVRIGGGVGVIDRGGGANGRPMFENNARYYAQLAGAPASVYDYTSEDGNDDVGTRSRFAAWDHEDGEDAVYIAWHTNAPSPARGTSSFAYGPSSFGPLSEFSGVPGSLELMDAVHTELIADLRAGWEADWQDRAQHTAFFGEVNPNHNPEMPAALFEIAFHDTAADADALRDPRFRRLAARAMGEGVARYFAARDGVALVLPPEPPTAVRMEQASDGLVLSWRPPLPDPAGGDEATGYRVYLSADGRAFDAGRVVADERLVLADVAVGQQVYARVTAVNDGGESFASAVAGARRSSEGAARVLVVGGFERIDRFGLRRDDLSAYDLATIERAFVDRINDRSHIARHGLAVAAADVSFDSATAAAVAAGDVDLSRYDVVDWFLGEESVADGPLDPTERAAIAAFVAGGGNLLITGSELVWALVERGDAQTQAFAADVLRVGYVADDAETYEVTGAGTPFEGVSLAFDDVGPGSFDAEFPDVLSAVDGGAIVLVYLNSLNGPNAGAATWWTDGTQHVVVMGFPFETVSGADARADLMARTLAEMGVPADEPAPPVGPDAGVGADDSGFTAGCGCRTRQRGPTGVGGFGVLFAALWLIRRSSFRPPRSRKRPR